MAARPKKRPSALRLNTDIENYQEDAPKSSTDPFKHFPLVDEVDEDDQLYLTLSGKENKAKKALQSPSLISLARWSHEDNKSHARHLANYISETVGRQSLDSEKAKEEERYWSALQSEDHHQHFDIEKMCTTLRARILASPTDPLPPSYNHVVLKIIEALEGATVKLGKVELPAQTSTRSEVHADGILAPVKTDDDLYEIVLNHSRQSPHASEKAGKIRLLDISMSPKQRLRKDRSYSEQPKGRQERQVALTAKSANVRTNLYGNSREGTSRMDLVHPLAPVAEPPPPKHQNVEKKPRNKDKLPPQARDSDTSTGRKSPHPMAAVASKFAFTSAKRLHRVNEPQNTSQLQDLCDLHNHHNVSNTPDVPRSAPPAGYSGKNSPTSASSAGSTAFKHRRQRSQSEAQSTRRFSFVPGDDAEVATFIVPSRSPQNRQPEGWREGEGEKCTGRENSTRVVEEQAGGYDTPRGAPKPTIRQVRSSS